MNKLIMFAVLGLLVVGCVSAITIRYSNPSIGFPESTEQPLKVNCPNDEWNDKFESFRNGDISKGDMKNYIGGCEW